MAPEPITGKIYIGNLILDDKGDWHDAWEYENRAAIERISRAMAEQCGQDPDMLVCLGQPDKVALPGTSGYRAGSEHPTRVKPLWRYYERLAIVAIRELNREDTKLGVGPTCPSRPGPSRPDTMAR